MIFWFGTTFWICRCNHISSIHRCSQCDAFCHSVACNVTFEHVGSHFAKCETKVHIIIDIWFNYYFSALMHSFSIGFFFLRVSIPSSYMVLLLTDIMSVVLPNNSIYTTCRSLLKKHSNLCRMMRQLNFTSMAMAMAMSSGKCFHCQNECSVSKSSLFIWCVDLNVRYPKFSQPLGVHLTDFAMYNCVCDAWDGCALLKMHWMR